MNKIGVDLIGVVSLLDTKSGRRTPINKEYWGHGNLKGNVRNDSYFIYLRNKEQLKPGEMCEAEFMFKFRNDERFEIKVRVGQVIELNEGVRKIGEFTIKQIVNEKLK